MREAQFTTVRLIHDEANSLIREKRPAFLRVLLIRLVPRHLLLKEKALGT